MCATPSTAVNLQRVHVTLASVINSECCCCFSSPYGCCRFPRANTTTQELTKAWELQCLAAAAAAGGKKKKLVLRNRRRFGRAGKPVQSIRL